MLTAVIGPLIGCVIGNFAYHAWKDRDWAKAIEWSVAQSALAIGLVATDALVRLL